MHKSSAMRGPPARSPVMVNAIGRPSPQDLVVLLALPCRVVTHFSEVVIERRAEEVAVHLRFGPREERVEEVGAGSFPARRRRPMSQQGRAKRTRGGGKGAPCSESILVLNLGMSAHVHGWRVIERDETRARRDSVERSSISKAAGGRVGRAKTLEGGIPGVLEHLVGFGRVED